jgi:ABC-type lipoprotein export system ATPase subunit
MLQLKNIAKYHSNGIQKNWVLKDISTTIFEGEFVSIMGPSGAGKSTLLNIIGMLEEPSGGEYYFLDEPVHKLSEKNAPSCTSTTSGLCFSSTTSSMN